MANTVWSAADSSRGVTLSGGNLIATSAGATDRGVRGADEKTSGKYYVEYRYNTSAGGDTGAGFAEGLADLNSSLPFSAIKGAIAYRSGNVWIGGGNQFNIGAAPTSTDRVCMAVDFDNHKVWFRLNGGNWNASGTDNPATNTGGFSIGGTGAHGGVIRYFPAAVFNATSDQITANFGDSAFAQAVPSGFTAGWPVNASIPADVFDVDQSGTAVALSNTSHTATLSTNAAGGAVNQRYRSGGKFLVATTMSSINTGGGTASSVCLGTVVSSYSSEGSSTESIAYLPSGVVKLNGSTVVTIMGYASGDVIYQAIDLDNQKIWYSKNGGNWNNDILANQNPATNTGGISLSTLKLPVVPGFAGATIGDAATINNGDSAFGIAVPLGFTKGWTVDGLASVIFKPQVVYFMC
jgi:hypothetical protein